jgi:hypothetical protein
MRESYMYPFQGYWGGDAHCHLAVYDHGGKVIVIATEPESNQGASITNMAEYLATQVWHEVGAPALEHFMWIERYPDRAFVAGRPALEESFDLVTFTATQPHAYAVADQRQYPTVLREPQWKPITQADVEELIGEPYVAPALDDPSDHRKPPAQQPARTTPAQDEGVHTFPPGPHVYRGIRVVDTNDRERFTIRCVVLADDQPLLATERARQHSPSGWEWGYGGSGPAALAHALLAGEFDVAVADRYYQQFKWDVVAHFEREQGGEEWQLTSADIRAWLERQQHDEGGAV